MTHMYNTISGVDPGIPKGVASYCYAGVIMIKKLLKLRVST